MTGVRKANSANDRRRLAFHLIYAACFVFLLSSVLIYIYFPPRIIGRPKLVIGGGSPRLSIDPVVKAMQRVLQDEFDVQIDETKGAGETLKKLAQGKLDLGLIHGHLEDPSDHGVKAVAQMFRSTLHVFVKSSSRIKKIQDISSVTRISIGPDESGTAALAKKLLVFYHLSPVIVPVNSFDEEIDHLKQDQVDVAFLCASIPMQWMAVESQNNLSMADKPESYRLLGVPHVQGVIRNHLALQEDTIHAGTYGPELPIDDVKTVAVPTILAVSPKYSSKTGTDSAITRILELLRDSNDETLRKHAQLMFENEDFARRTGFYPLHPAARRFFAHEPQRSFVQILAEIVTYLTAVGSLLTIGVGIIQVWPIVKQVGRRTGTTVEK